MRSATLPIAIAMTLLTAATIHGQTPSTGLMNEGHAQILDFGWRGEALRHVSPTTRPHERNVSDLTGARVTAGAVYTVADIQFERIEHADEHIVWVKLVAD